MKTQSKSILLILLIILNDTFVQSSKLQNLKPRKLQKAELEKIVQEKLEIVSKLPERKLKILEQFTALETKKERDLFLKVQPRKLSMWIAKLIGGGIVATLGAAFLTIVFTRIYNEIKLFFDIRRLKKEIVIKEAKLNIERDLQIEMDLPIQKEIDKLYDIVDDFNSQVDARILDAAKDVSKYVGF